MTDKRICLIIDAGFYIGTQKATGSIDILKLKNLIEQKLGRVERGYYITAMETDNMRGFHSFIRSVKGPKLEVVVKNQKMKTCDNCGKQVWVEKGVDVAISTLAIKNAQKDLYDTLVLLNGDADLLDALTYIRDDLRKEIVICGELSNIATEMQAIASKVLLLSDYIEEIRTT